VITPNIFTLSKKVGNFEAIKGAPKAVYGKNTFGNAYTLIDIIYAKITIHFTEITTQQRVQQMSWEQLITRVARQKLG